MVVTYSASNRRKSKCAVHVYVCAFVHACVCLCACARMRIRSLLYSFLTTIPILGSRSDPKSDSDSGKKTKSKPTSKLSHNLFTSGSFEDEDSGGDLFSPMVTSRDLSTATPTVKTTAAATGGGSTTKAAGERKDPLFSGTMGRGSTRS